LHDVGQWILASQAPAEYQGQERYGADAADPETAPEARRARVLHARLGAYLLGLWGLPRPIVDAVPQHHEPSLGRASGFAARRAAHVADCLAPLAHLPESEARDVPGLDQRLLRSLGLAERVPEWLAAARAAVDSEERA